MALHAIGEYLPPRQYLLDTKPQVFVQREVVVVMTRSVSEKNMQLEWSAA
jgi:hypothetical protein